MADEVLDSLQIKVTAETSDAESKIKKLVETLDKIKVGGISKAAAEKLKAISDAAKGIDGGTANKVEKLATAIKSLNDAKISASLANQISKIGDALKFIDDGDIERLQKLTDSIEKINASGGVGNIKVQTPKVDKSAEKPQFQNLSDSILSVGKQINLQVDTTQVEHATEMVEYLSQMLAQISGRQLMPPQADVSGFEDMRNAIEGSVESMGVFQTTGKITNVEIQDIGEKAKGASGKAKLLSASLLAVAAGAKKLGSIALKSAASGLKKLGSAVGSVAKNVAMLSGKFLASPFTALGKAVSGATGKFKSLLRSMGRIALYRAIRSAIKAITQGFKEGINNAYEWSKINGGQLAKSMNSLATNAQYIKNSFGAMAAPLLNALAPAIDFIADKLVALVNLFNQVFAKFTGQTTWMRATKQAVEYQGAADGATAATKKFKATILGIDEINPLQDNSDNGGGSGGGGADYAGMFEEVPIDSEISDFVQGIKDAINAGDWEEVGEILAEKINGLTDKIYEAIKWENVEPKIKPFIENMGTAFNSLVDNVDWEKIGQTIGAGLNTITNSVEAFFDSFNIDELGTSLSDVVNGFIGEVDWENIGETVSKGFNEITAAVNNFAYNTNWKELGENFGKSISEFISNIDAEEIGRAGAAPFEAINQAISGLFDNFAENGTWAEAGKKLGAAINSWFSSIDWQTVRDNITRGVDGIVAALENLFDETNWKDIGKDLGEVINGVVNIDWGNVGETIGKGAAGILDTLSEAIKTVNWKQLGADIVDLIMGVDWKSLFKSAGNSISSILGGAIDIVTGYIQTFDFKEVVKTLVGAIVGFLSGFDWSSFASKLAEFAGTFIGKLLALPGNIAELIGEFFTNLVQKIVSYFKEKKAEWDEAGISIWEGIFQGIWNGIKNIGTWIKEKILDPFIQGFKNAFGIHSPSTVMAEMGGYLIDGLKNGLGNIWEAIKGKFADMLQNIKDWFVEKKDELVAAWDAFKSGIGEIVTTLKGKIEDSWNAAKEAWTNLSDKAKDLWANLKGKIEDAFTSAKEKWDSISEKAKDLWMNLKASVAEKWDELKTSWTNLKTETKELTANLVAKLGTAAETVKGWWNNILNWFRGGSDKKTASDDREFTIGAKLLSGLANTVKGWWDTIVNWFRGGTSKKAVDTDRQLSIGAKNTTTKNDTKSWWEKIKEKWGTKTLGLGASVSVSKSTVKDWVNKIQSVYNQSGPRLEIAINGKLKKVSVPSSLNATQLAKQGIVVEYTAAKGGMFKQGEVFLAREAGPEMVGSIGGHTAVANNEQIVEGISSGVYAANQEQNALLRQQNALLAQLLEKDSGGGGQVTVSSIVTGVDRYNRRAGKTVMATA